MTDHGKFLLAVIVAFGFGVVGYALAQPTGTNTVPNKVPVTVVANLPTCNAGNEGLSWGVSDQNSTVAYNGPVTGSGINHQSVYCTGTAWVQQ
jgi:hypothetical protein